MKATQYTYNDYKGVARLVVMRGTVVYADHSRSIFLNRVRKSPKRFDVHYGLQRWDNQDYTNAWHKLGEAIGHAIQCEDAD
jgi:hypothetical protein